MVTFTSFIISYYTCYLIVKSSRRDSDFSDTVRRYYGKFPPSFELICFLAGIGSAGFYTGAVMSAVLLTGILIVYFVIQTQLLYPLTLAVYKWTSGNEPVYLSEPTFS